MAKKTESKKSPPDRIAIYPGTFDPITNGHVDLIKRALFLFDQVIVLVAHSRSKHPLFTGEERKKLVEECFKRDPRVTVDLYDGLLADYAKRKNVKVILRGLRAVSDFEYEFQMATINNRMNEDLQTFCLMSSEQFFFVNSTLVKEVFSHGGDVSSLVPPHVVAKLQSSKDRL